MDERAFDRKLDRKATRKEAATKIKLPAGKKQPAGRKQIMESGLDLYRSITGPPEGKKRAKDLAAEGVELPHMDEITLEGNLKNARAGIKRKVMGLDPRTALNVYKLENNKEFISLLTNIDKTQAKDLMTIAMLESRMDPKAGREGKDGATGLFQVKPSAFTRDQANKANKILKSIGSKKRITKHSHLLDPVMALAYESGKGSKKGVVDKYKLHQQQQAGMNRQKIITMAPDSAFMMFHAKGMKDKKKMDLPNLQGMMSISDVDDGLAAIISNVTGNDKIRVQKLKDYIRKMWKEPKERMNASAAELDKKTFRAVKRAIELYNKKTTEHVRASEAASKGDILKRAAAGRTGSKK